MPAAPERAGSHRHPGGAMRTSESARHAAQATAQAFEALVDALNQASDELDQLDAVRGHGDLGLRLAGGLHAARSAVVDAADAGAGPAQALGLGASAWRARDTDGATLSWPSLVEAFASGLDDGGAITRHSIRGGIDAVAAVTDGSSGLGHVVGPFAEELGRGIDDGDDLAAAWAEAADVAEEAAQETAALASGGSVDDAVGTPDPAAVAFALVVATIADVLAERNADLA